LTKKKKKTNGEATAHIFPLTNALATVLGAVAKSQIVYKQVNHNILFLVLNYFISY